MQETVESQSLQRRAWRRLVYAALIATTLIAVATQIDIPIVSDVVRPKEIVPCQEDPACRAFVRAEINRALQKTLKDLETRAADIKRAFREARRREFFAPDSGTIRSLEGGDATGPPSGGGGPAGGGEPPPEQGVLDPIIDPVAPGADCDVTIEDVILCTEPDS